MSVLSVVTKCPNGWGNVLPVRNGTVSGSFITHRTSMPEKSEMFLQNHAGFRMWLWSPLSVLQRVSVSWIVFLGGGLSPGVAILLGGEPGIGKSTLMLQLAAWLGARGGKSLYISGEESVGQLKGRAERLEINQNNVDVLCETHLPSIMGRLATGGYSLLIVDSIQTMVSDVAGGMPGTVNQIKMAGYQLASWSKNSGVPLFSDCSCNS